jgi:hypothetical protein
VPIGLSGKRGTRRILKAARLAGFAVSDQFPFTSSANGGCLNLHGRPESALHSDNYFASDMPLGQTFQCLRNCFQRMLFAMRRWPEGPAISSKESTDCRPSVSFDVCFAGAVIPAEHGLVHWYPEQQSDGVVSRQEGIV